jgi:hypothetical protein
MGFEFVTGDRYSRVFRYRPSPYGRFISRLSTKRLTTAGILDQHEAAFIDAVCQYRHIAVVRPRGAKVSRAVPDASTSETPEYSRDDGHDVCSRRRTPAECSSNENTAMPKTLAALWFQNPRCGPPEGCVEHSALDAHPYHIERER